MQTSDPSIFAVGDAVETRNPVLGRSGLIPLAGPAAKQARVAVNTIFDIGDSYDGTIGTSVVKVFSLTAATTGANERSLKAADIPYQKIYGHYPNHASYYPGATRLTMKVLFNTRDGRILGAQVIGAEGVDKRIDVLAVAVQHGMNVFDLAKFELSYAPPYGSAKDPVNFIGMVGENHLDGIAELTCFDQLDGNEFLLDVRTPAEVAAGAVPGAQHIPVDELRERLGEVPQDKVVAVFCQSGVRSHLACRILNSRGYTAKNAGGYLTYALLEKA